MVLAAIPLDDEHSHPPSSLTCFVVQLHALQAALGRLPPLLLAVGDVPAAAVVQQGAGQQRLSWIRPSAAVLLHQILTAPATPPHTTGVPRASPLVCERHHALVAAARHHRLLRLCKAAAAAAAAARAGDRTSAACAPFKGKTTSMLLPPAKAAPLPRLLSPPAPPPRPHAPPTTHTHTPHHTAPE